MATTSRGVAITPVGLPEERRQDNMALMQMEALSKSRRERITTTDTRERKAEFVPLGMIQRRVDRDGTEENLTTRGKVRTQLAAWSTAWENLYEEDPETPALKDINEGLGQTHRAKLQAENILKSDALEDDHYHFRGSQRVPGNRGGRRDDGFAGRIERLAPFKRARVVKGSTSPSQVNGSSLIKSVQTHSIQQVSSPSFLQKSSGNGRISRARSNAPIQRPAPKPKEGLSKEPSRLKASYSGKLATPNDFMASINRTPQTQIQGGPKLPRHAEEASVVATAHVEGATHKVNGTLGEPEDKKVSLRSSSPQTDLMDLDVEQQVSHQPVIAFTHPSSGGTGINASGSQLTPIDITVQDPLVLTKITPFIENIKLARTAGLLNKSQLKTLENIVHELQNRADKQATEPVKATVPNKPTKVGSYSRADILALRPKTASPPPKVAIASFESSKLGQGNPKPMPNIVTPPLADIELKKSIVKQLEAQREHIVGEHVHRTRFQRADSIGKFSDLSVVDSASSNSTCPIQPPHGPSLPAHLAKVPSVKDHGAATRAEYAISGSASSKSSGAPSVRGPTLPAHLTKWVPVVDQGAAVRAQYSS